MRTPSAGAVSARAIVLLLVAAPSLVACGDFPRPFQGNPGPVAARLAVPPPPLLAVPTPRNALLPNAASQRFAADLATELARRTVPAVAETSGPRDWQLSITAALNDDKVVPRYTVVGPLKHVEGSVQGKPVPAASWANGEPSLLQAAAEADAPAIASLLTEIDARIKHSNPASLMNRPARVYFAGVVKAPGDGDTLLGSALQRDLPDPTLVLLPSRSGADFSVLGEVTVTPAPARQVRVELQWVLTDANGRERGRVVQLNQVPVATIEPSWADVAPTIADQAALGLRQLVEKARLAP